MHTKPFNFLRELFAAIALLLSMPAPVFSAQTSLPAYAADLTQTSVSGLSSGAFMAAQFEVAFSNSLVGAGIVAGGPFYCSGSQALNSFVINATTTCMKPLGRGPDAEKLVKSARHFAQLGEIDNLDGLKKHRVYLFSGSNDSTVMTKVVDQTLRFLELAGVPKDNIEYRKASAGHALITKHPNDTACELTAPPYINNCGIDQAQDILKQIYGNLNPPSNKLSGKIIAFNQREFIDSDRSSMSDDAYAYVPASCDKVRCKVHIALHGCQQGAAVIGDRYYTTTEYNEIADTNDIIVLYPQAQPSDPIPYNPRGCWDFWGYSSVDKVKPNFYSKEAPQMKAIDRMLKRLGQARTYGVFNIK